MTGAIFGYYDPEAAVVAFGIVIGVLVGIWMILLYEAPFLIAVLSSLLFYVIYGIIAYQFVFRNKKKK